MFSRLFSSSKSELTTKDSKRNDDPPSNAVGLRSASPTVTEPASISTSVPPGSPTRGCAPRTPSPIPGSSVNMDSESLRALIKSCPAKTVYSYTLSQIEVQEGGLAVGPLHTAQKFFASIASYVPASILFSFRILLSGVLIIFVTAFLFALLPSKSQTERP